MHNKIGSIIEMEHLGELKTLRGLFERPHYEQENVLIPYMSTSTYVAGRGRWSNVKIKFFDSSNESLKWIYEWMEDIVGRHSEILETACNSKKNIKIKTFNMEGKLIEDWTLIGAQMTSFKSDVINRNFYNDDLREFPDFFLSILTRYVLIEKINNCTLQIILELELSLDRFILI